MAIFGNFEHFQYFNFETNFLKNENHFQKNLEYRFLVESAKIENAIFRHKTVLSEAMEWGVQNGVTKNGVLPVTTFFVKILF